MKCNHVKHFFIHKDFTLPTVLYTCQKSRQTDELKTRQSMFVKHVPPLWAYFTEATKL